ncbi:vanadium-dependent haloperoxidase [Phytohabitans houttuyneae]|uniref:Phosphatidic acid phosphatase type 2/haloperoxidase domain-containing protein n=1 Tax=Phytohabitans houttuyneae TaxID=1076126 RepID=A0A6V8KIH5_9ACTN|nr:vanadium-dependent haloperoxidase [Phytohabitans houttuyneae]GFJ81796.1 hypothetical protein Phou_059760 [Phytohabitans houttuyneae]
MAVAAAVAVTSAPASASPAAPRAANPVVTWDLNTQTAVYDVARQQPWVQSRSFAMVNGAVFDALNAIAGTPYQPYLGAPAASGRESTDAAVAAAAFGVLVSLFPEQEQRLREQYDQSLAAVPDGAAERGGVRVGSQAASRMIAARRDDGVGGGQTWVIGTEPGQWRPTPPTFASEGASGAHLKPFLVPWVSHPYTSGPPALASDEYARDVNEIQQVGSLASTVRTADQTEAAIWWHDRRIVEWYIKRQLAETGRLNPLQTARMFAMVDVIAADTGIACFAAKAQWSFWRPVTAIREAGTDGNPATQPDPEWTPLLVTPPFPDYPSGHSCATGARMSTLAAFFGRDTMTFSAYSADADATRTFTSFSQALTELVQARIWGGIHYRDASEDGATLGKAVARYGVARFARPRR